jgi:hypothetical protein
MMRNKMDSFSIGYNKDSREKPQRGLRRYQWFRQWKNHKGVSLLKRRVKEVKRGGEVLGELSHGKK